jgi:hypothetical protein
MARSTGVFPREKFDLDNALKVLYDEPTDAAVALNSVNTWRVIVLGATGLGTSSEQGYIAASIGSNLIDFHSEDIDSNGVGIIHIRGSSCEEGQNTIWFYSYNGASAEAVYLDAVDNVG